MQQIIPTATAATLTATNRSRHGNQTEQQTFQRFAIRIKVQSEKLQAKQLENSHKSIGKTEVMLNSANKSQANEQLGLLKMENASRNLN